MPLTDTALRAVKPSGKPNTLFMAKDRNAVASK